MEMNSDSKWNEVSEEEDVRAFCAQSQVLADEIVAVLRRAAATPPLATAALVHVLGNVIIAFLDPPDVARRAGAELTRAVNMNLANRTRQ
jgi:hypothetical protein